MSGIRTVGVRIVTHERLKKICEFTGLTQDTFISRMLDVFEQTMGEIADEVDEIEGTDETCEAVGDVGKGTE